MAIVKADAYGHGAVECSKQLEASGAEWLGVALPEEGLELREAGIHAPILCLGSFWYGQEDLILANRLTPVVYQMDMARRLDRAAGERGITADMHVKVDTGMGRIGLRYDEVDTFADELKLCGNLRLEGLMTHFAAADDLSQNEFTDMQTARFYDALASFEGRGFRPTFIDLANSPGAVAHPGTRGNMVRLGGVLYGLGGDVLPSDSPKPDLRPVMSLHSEISHIKNVPAGESIGYGRTFTTEKDSVIASVPIGYEDGYRRALSNKARVIVNGSFAPVVGRISMDWTIVDVTGIDDVAVGSRVTLIGQDSGLSLTAEDLASLLETISYEITCGINSRVPRTFKFAK
jgi:alanine racemase